MIKKRIPFFVVLTMALVLLILAAYFTFTRNFQGHMRQDVSVRLQEIVSPNVASFNLQIQEQIKKVKTLADFLGKSEELGSPSNRELLISAVKNNGLLRCALAFPDGTFITHDDKNQGNVADNSWFQANMRGEFCITDPMPAVVDKTKTVILFTCPVKKEGKVIGSVIYSYLCDDINTMFNLNFLGGQGQLLVVNRKGNILIGSSTYLESQGNLISTLRTLCTHKKHTAGDCLSIGSNQGNCSITFPNSSSPLLAHYDKLAYNDWYMFSTVPENAATDIISNLTQEQQRLSLFVAFCISAYVAALLIAWMLQRNHMDKLTGAPTLDRFRVVAKRLLHSNPTIRYVFVKLDIKNFKLINRVYSFEEGNRVIKNIASALALVVGDQRGAFARMGTDDFIILLPYRGRKDLQNRRDQFVSRFREMMGPSFTTVVEFPTGQYVLTEEENRKPDISEILEKVNFAHRAAKQQQWGGTIVDYVEDLEKEALLEKSIEDKMSSALQNDEFILYLQPKFAVKDEAICGAEALVRWEVNGKFFMHPTAFIPILERNGFIVRIDMYMFEQAVRHLRTLLDKGFPPITISVNFSRTHLSNEKFVEELCAITGKYEVPNRYLEIELTESAVFDNVDRIIQLIQQLHAVGFTMSMDDFGSGYSCLALLKDLPVDVLKLDKGFFDRTADPTRARTVIASIIRMARDLGVTTVAEGVELKSQVDMLRDLGCTMIQGFYFSRPLPASQLLPPTSSPTADTQ